MAGDLMNCRCGGVRENQMSRGGLNSRLLILRQPRKWRVISMLNHCTHRKSQRRLGIGTAVRRTATHTFAIDRKKIQHARRNKSFRPRYRGCTSNERGASSHRSGVCRDNYNRSGSALSRRATRSGSRGCSGGRDLADTQATQSLTRADSPLKFWRGPVLNRELPMMI